MPRFLTLALGLALALAAAPPALAVPPANDNYLGSIGVTGSQTVDTTEATTQADLFDPNRDGLPFGGSGPEPLSCPVAPSYGKTVWYDFKPPAPGGIRIATTGAFDNVIAVYEWTEATSQLGRLVACVNATAGVSEELLMALRETQLHDAVRRRRRRRRRAQLHLRVLPGHGRRHRPRRGSRQVPPAARHPGLRRLPAGRPWRTATHGHRHGRRGARRQAHGRPRGPRDAHRGPLPSAAAGRCARGPSARAPFACAASRAGRSRPATASRCA